MEEEDVSCGRRIGRRKWIHRQSRIEFRPPVSSRTTPPSFESNYVAFSESNVRVRGRRRVIKSIGEVCYSFPTTESGRWFGFLQLKRRGIRVEMDDKVDRTDLGRGNCRDGQSR